MQSRELVKLYYRIGEVSEIVGVQPHVLRYWETEFRSIRPQKSSKGQRVYSRRDVEKLLRVKDLLRNQGFTIAGARKRLSDPADATHAPSAPVPQAPLGVVAPASVAPAVMPPVTPLHAVAPAAAAPAAATAPGGGAALAAVVSLVDTASSAAPARSAPAAEATPGGRMVGAAGAADHRAKDMRKALLGLRQDLLQMLADINATRAQQPRGH